jgi:hypothetical protein
VTLSLLALTDLALGTWHGGVRLPTHFSSEYLQRYAENAGPGAVVVLGDSEMWGYGIRAADGPVAQLASALQGDRVANFAYEAETPVNADFVLRYLLARNLRPRAVLVEINPASFNETAPAYDTLNAALAELCVPALVEPFDRDRLNAVVHPQDGAGERLDRFVADHWLLYGLRVDVHQALFGDADLATALQRLIEPFLQPMPRGADSAAYAMMYDLTPLDASNVSYAYAEHLFTMLAARRIPALVVLPPVNHALLHLYIDNAAYAANLARVQRLARDRGLAVLNLDSRFAASDFIDNTHLNPIGSARLAQAIRPRLAKLLHVL